MDCAPQGQRCNKRKRLRREFCPPTVTSVDPLGEGKSTVLEADRLHLRSTNTPFGVPLRRRIAWLVTIGASVWACGCSPALDWRDVSLAATDLIASFPCPPSSFEREVSVADQSMKMFLLACDASGATYGVSTIEVGDPRRVDAVLLALRLGAGRAIGDTGSVPEAFRLRGATPYPASQTVRLVGRRQDGRAVEEEIFVFARGTRVFQASVIATALAQAQTAPFREGLHFVTAH